MSKEHCSKDFVDQRPLPRKKEIEKTAFEILDLSDRKRYIKQILDLRCQNVLLICCDETPIGFGGSIHHSSHAPPGVVVHNEKRNPIFKKHQWAAACCDTRARRPFLVWNQV